MRTVRSFLPNLLTCLVVALLLVVAGCGEDGDQPIQPANGDSGDGGSAKAQPDDKNGADDADDWDFDDDEPKFRTAAECGKCHDEIYREWKASYHGRAMSDPLFLEFSANIDKEECIRCHAPVSLREAGFETPIARAELRDDAISCLTCHRSGANVTGPFKGLKGACNPVYDADQSDVVKMCFACHNQHDTGNEWLRGPYAPDAPEPRTHPEKSCLDCHMEKVLRPLVKGGEKRWGRRHTWPGGHDLRQLKLAAKLEVTVEPLEAGGHRFRVWVTNTGAGHSIPTDARHRSLDTYVAIWNADGTPLLDPLKPLEQGRAQAAKYKKQYRTSGLRDTQIAPGERVSAAGEWKGYVDVPEAVSGRGEAWLVYRLTPRHALNKKSLDPANPHDLGTAEIAPIVVKVEFTFGK